MNQVLVFFVVAILVVVAIKIAQVVITDIHPNTILLQKATMLAAASTELATKEKQVLIAQKESERMAALSSSGSLILTLVNMKSLTLSISCCKKTYA
jgi:galactitol-specific phosphotransferase system IIC component